jgi:hypothetical protein
MSRRTSYNLTVKPRWLLLLLGLLVSPLQGCFLLLLGSGAAVGAGAVAYSHGELVSVEPAKFEPTWDGVQEAVRDLGLVVTDQHKEPDAASLDARTADNEEVTIHLSAKSVTATEIRIRVGTFGNEALSRVILEKIKRNIGTG